MHENRRPSKGRKRLRPLQTVRRRSEFKTIFEKGVKKKGAFLMLWSLPAGTPGPSCLGIVVGRKAEARAARRNLWKRRIREIFRIHSREIQPGHSLIVMVLKCKKIPDSSAIEADMMRLLTTSGLLDRP